MRCRLLVLVWLAFHFAQAEATSERTELAQILAEEEAKDPELCQTGCSESYWKEDKTKTETSDWTSSGTPPLPVFSLADTSAACVYNDLALSCLQSQQRPQNRMVQELWPVLEPSLESAQEEQKQISQECSQIVQCQEAGGRRQYDGFLSHNSSMGTIDPCYEANSQTCGTHRQQGVGSSSSTGVTTTSSCHEWRSAIKSDCRRGENFDTFAWAQDSNAFDAGAARSVGSSGDQRSCSENGQAIESWAFESSGKDEVSGSGNGQENSKVGCRMDSTDGKSDIQSTATCSDVSGGQAGAHGSLQCQGRDSAQTPGGVECSIQNPDRTASGQRASSRCTQCGGADGHSLLGNESSMWSAHDLRRRDGRNREGHRSGRRAERAEGETDCAAQSSVSSVDLPIESCKPPFEGEEHGSEEAELRWQPEWSGIDATKFVLDEDEDVPSWFETCTMSMHQISNECPDKHVRFSVECELHMWDESHELYSSLPCIRFHDWFRNMWHMDGQCGDWNFMKLMCSRIEVVPWNFVRSQRVENLASDSNVIAAASREHVPNPILQRGSENELRVQWSALSGFWQRTVKTWYLREGDYHCCIHHRMVRVIPNQDFDAFKRMRRAAWTDLFAEGDFELVVVRQASSAIAGSEQWHVILVQQRTRHFLAAVFHFEGFPILRKQRAILFRAQSTPRELFRVAQVRTDHHDHGTFFEAAVWRWDYGHQTFTNGEEVQCEDAVFIHGQIRIEPDEEESDQGSEPGSLNQSTASRSTATGRCSDSDDSLDDETAFMNVNPPWLQWEFDRPEPYPWENDQVEDDGSLLDDDPQPLVLDHQAEMIFDHLVDRSAMVDVQDSMTAVTYGLGLVSLGRRDVTFNGRDVEHLAHRIVQVWSDHADRAQMEIMYVIPQPQPRSRNTIVLVVAFSFGHEDPQDSRVLVVEHAVDTTCANPYAARLNGRVSARSVIVQLGLEDCFPNSIRDCQITQCGQQMDRDEYVDIMDGCLLVIMKQSFPEHVRVVQRCFANVEQFLIHVRSNAEQREDAEEPIIVRCHGISPTNRPLGFRDLVFTLDDLGGISWSQRITHLWPFYERNPPTVHAVISATDEPYQEDGKMVYHVVVSYADTIEGVPILIRQTAVAQQGRVLHQEHWAVALHQEATMERLMQRMTAPPFWVLRGWRIAFYRETRPLQDHHSNFRIGETIDLDVRVLDSVDVMTLLLDHYQEEDAFADIVSLLQLPDEQIHEPNQDSEPGVQNQPHEKQNQDVDERIRSLKENLKVLCDTPWTGLNEDFQVLPQMHPMARVAIESSKQKYDTGNVFHVFTDGSYDRGIGAWAFVLLAEQTTSSGIEIIRIGYSGALIDPEETEASAMSAEAVAIVAACEFLLTKSSDQRYDIHSHYDALNVGHGAVGWQAIPKSSLKICRAARIMCLLLQRKFEQVHGKHVHAHEGCPWNDFADSLAVSIRLGWKCPIEPALRHTLVTRHELAEWAWLEIAPNDEFPSIAEILVNGVPAEEDMHCDTTLEPVKRSQSTFSVTWTFATANVGTMHYQDQDSDLANSHRSEAIQLQMQEAGVDFAAIQETRAKNSQTVQNDTWIRFISAGQHGQAGVEFWVNAKAFHSKTGYRLQNKLDFTIWHSSSRCIAVNIAAGVNLNCIVIYAPQSGHDDGLIEAWWNELRQVLTSRPNDAPMILLGDCNAKVGSVTTPQIGPLSCDVEDAAGTQMRMLADAFDLIVPSTFADYHSGQNHTYLGPRHSQSRIDYVMVDQRCEAGIVSTWVDDDIELFTGAFGHHALFLQMQMKFTDIGEQGFVRVNVYDRTTAQEHLRTHRTHEKLLLEPAPWQVGVNTHWRQIRSKLLGEAAKAFPKQKRKKRQEYITTDTWNDICARKDLKNLHRQTWRNLAWHTLQMCFHAWKSDQHKAQWHRLCIHTLRLQDAVQYEQMLNLQADLRQRKKRDWKQWVDANWEAKVLQSRNAAGTDVFKVFQPKKMLQKHAGKLRMPLPGYCDQTGKWQTSRAGITGAWQRQFQEIENAKEITYQELSKMSIPNVQKRSVDFLTDMPTILDLEDGIRSLSTNKACGVDGLGTELLKINLPTNIQRLYMLFAKTALRSQSPVDLTGGWLIPLHKGKQPSHLMGGYRAILLEATAARAFARTWRKKIGPTIDGVAAPMQMGGRPGQSIETAHLHVRLWQSTSRAVGASLGLLFVDLKSAFFAAVKPLITGFGGNMHEAAEIFRMLKLPPDAFQPFLRNLHEASLIEKTTQSQAATGMVCSMLKHTWFAIPGGDRMYAPQTGSRPGNPMADWLFSLIVARMLNEINNKLEDAQVFCNCPNDQIALAQNVTWVDDMVFAIHTTADKVAGKTAQVLAEVLQTCTEHGFHLTYGQGKTAIMIDFRGKNSQKCRREFETRFKTGMQVLTEYCTVTVPVVPFYKHLGGHITRSGNILPEITTRANQATARLKPLHKLVKTPDLPIEKRRLILKSFVLPVLTLHAGTWFNLGLGEYRAWQAALFKIYATVQQRFVGDQALHFTLHELARAMQSPMPMEYLHVMKLRLVAHILQSCDLFLICSIVHNHHMAKEGSWLHGVWNSFHWMSEQISPKEIPEEVNRLDDADTWTVLQPYAKVLKKQIHAATHAHMWRLRMFCELRETEQQHKDMMQEVGWKFAGDDHASQTDHVRHNEVTCSTCGATFMSEAALATHEQRKHQGRIGH